ncbi:uncharacterized protein A4U43_C02F16530 [Asparagus officinalis]|uniref:Uncharacterized protein n=1 Tax=Asparagus officinalis TaxID=4686 RepID=A0A5P1FKL8_ASPOF|nr:uncharacterized protein A4U43_C02F16530 [Asparagus officinalis]
MGAISNEIIRRVLKGLTFWKIVALFAVFFFFFSFGTSRSTGKIPLFSPPLNLAVELLSAFSPPPPLDLAVVAPVGAKPASPVVASLHPRDLAVELPKPSSPLCSIPLFSPPSDLAVELLSAFSPPPPLDLAVVAPVGAKPASPVVASFQPRRSQAY